MEQQLKQRLVGVTVIFSLAVIFLPMLLDGSGKRPKHLKISIPLPPEVDSYELVDDKIKQLKIDVEKFPKFETVVIDDISDPPELQKTEVQKEGKKGAEKVRDNAIQSAAKTLKKSEPVVKPTETKTASVKSKPVTEETKQLVGGKSWVIQVGSFSDKKKAYSQRDKLRKSGLAAVFIEKYKHDRTLSYRVRMGPFISRQKARVIGNKVRAKYNIKGLVMNYVK